MVMTWDYFYLTGNNYKYYHDFKLLSGLRCSLDELVAALERIQRAFNELVPGTDRVHVQRMVLSILIP